MGLLHRRCYWLGTVCCTDVVHGEQLMSFSFFLLSLFVIGCRLTCLETSANPCVTSLGHPESGSRRLNSAQSFNGLGWIFGPMVGNLLIWDDNSQLVLPYAVISVMVLGSVFYKLRLPEPRQDADALMGYIDETNIAVALLFH